MLIVARCRRRVAARAAAGLIATALLPTALLTTGCGDGTGVQAPPTSTRIPVVASLDSWGSILDQLGGNRVRETSIVSSPAINARHYRPTPAEVAAIAGARVLVVNGIGYDGWAAATAAAHPAADRQLVDVGAVLSVGAGGNPNQSYSQSAVRRVADAITQALQAADPAGRAYFATRRMRFETTALGPLDALEASIRKQYAGSPIGASSPIAEPLAQSMDLDLQTPPSFLAAVGSGTTPSPADTAAVLDQLTDRRIRVYLDDLQRTTPAVLLKAAEKADVPVVTLTETLSPKDATFQAWQVQQLTALRTALAQQP